MADDGCGQRGSKTLCFVMEKREDCLTTQRQMPGRRRCVRDPRECKPVAFSAVQPGMNKSNQGTQAAHGRHSQQQGPMVTSGMGEHGKQSLLGLKQCCCSMHGRSKLGIGCL